MNHTWSLEDLAVSGAASDYLVKLTSYIGGMSAFTKYVINVGGAKLKRIIRQLIQ